MVNTTVLRTCSKIDYQYTTNVHALILIENRYKTQFRLDEFPLHFVSLPTCTLSGVVQGPVPSVWPDQVLPDPRRPPQETITTVCSHVLLKSGFEFVILSFKYVYVLH